MSKFKDKYEGRVFTTKRCGDVVLINYNNKRDVTVRFSDGYELNCQIQSVLTGEISNPYTPTYYGVGLFGVGPHSSRVWGDASGKWKSSEAYNCWTNMFKRCYCEAVQKKQPTYIGCSVSKAWYNFQAFADWFVADRYRLDSWHLDKDVLVKGNKVYSPETCIFLPEEINVMFTQRRRKEVELPSGVVRHGKRFRSQYSSDMWESGCEYLGVFDTIEEAFSVYKIAKQARVKMKAEKWKNHLDPKAYTALINYEFTMKE